MRRAKIFISILVFSIAFTGCQVSNSKVPEICLEHNYRSFSFTPTENKLMFLGPNNFGSLEVTDDLNMYNLQGELLSQNNVTFSDSQKSWKAFDSNSSNWFIAGRKISNNGKTGIGVTKMTLDNNPVWTKFVYCNDSLLSLFSMSVNEQGDIYVVGTFKRDDSFPGFVIQLNKEGSIVYKKEFSITSSSVTSHDGYSFHIFDTTVDNKGNMYFTGFTDSIGESPAYWEMGIFGKINAQGELDYVNGLMEEGRRGFTQCKDIQWLPDNRILITGISGAGGLYILECNELGDCKRTLLIPDFPHIFMPHVVSYGNHYIVAKTIQEGDKDNLLLLDIKWESNSIPNIESTSWYPNVGNDYTSRILSPYNYNDTIVFPFYQKVENTILLLPWYKNTNALSKSRLAEKKYSETITCNEITNTIVMEDWLTEKVVLVEDLTLNVETLEDFIKVK